MMRNDTPIRITALALSVTIVAGAMFVLATTSNANFALAAAAVQQYASPPATEVAIAPSRIEVIGVREVRTARVPAATPRPQS